MTAVERPAGAPAQAGYEHGHVHEGIVAWLTTTDHKKVGVLYMAAALIFFAIGGLMSLLMRAELAAPGIQLLDLGTYNQLFTMHGTAMIFFFATPMVIGLANYLVPLQIGAPDVAFPRLNAFTFWLFLFSALIVFGGFALTTGAAAFGWYGYPPLSTATYSPGLGGDLWVMGLFLSGISSILGAVNLIATMFALRAPGMSMFRLPLFTWNILATSILIMLCFPVLGAALAMLFIDRNLGGSFFTDAGDPIVYQHLFWFFGHPEVYIIALPFFGVITEIVPVFSRQPLFGYKAFVFATILIASYSFSVWAHHMFTTGAVNNVYFAITSFLIAIPTGVKFFGWTATMWRGSIWFATPMLFVVGGMAVFLIGGITGIFLASPPIDYVVHDTYYVVAHMHYVMFGTAAFAMFGAIYYWYPKFTGHMLDEGLGKLHFWLLFIGFNVTFFPMHELGLDGMPRRIGDYVESTGWGDLNLLATVGTVVIAAAVLVFAWNFLSSLSLGKPAGDDPWGGHTLEWATSSPPPHHNFTRLPPITSDRPVLDERLALPERTGGEPVDPKTSGEEPLPSRSQEDRHHG
ncbi:MAG TPA: cytochrome c oxidase subunit I [Candidatus Limnocylindria bacterium]|nr:cytochrome c oxidase subunit I [Candidatus Limnocylindria bacterium]